MLITESHAHPGAEKMSIIRELFICSGGGGVGDDVVDEFPLSSVVNVPDTSCWMAAMTQE